MTGLFWTPEAVGDREAIFDHILADNPMAALAMDELFEAQSLQLIAQPHLGRLGRVAGTREWVAHPSYVLIYDLLGPQIRLLRVLHTARQWPSQAG